MNNHNHKDSKSSKSVGGNYVYRSYYSNSKKNSKTPPPEIKSRSKILFVFGVVIIILAIGTVNYIKTSSDPESILSKITLTDTPKPKPKITATVNMCAGNSSGTKLVIVSVGQRHLWACYGATKEYNAAVVTGYAGDPADITPIGTYSIYAKETDVYLKGSDSRGSWDDFVNYWMPFLYNQYGAYGFHDATWRAPSAFGNISPNSTNSSHGCVEMPLAAAQWLYSWAPIGTSVSIQT